MPGGYSRDHQSSRVEHPVAPRLAGRHELGPALDAAIRACARYRGSGPVNSGAITGTLGTSACHPRLFVGAHSQSGRNRAAAGTASSEPQADGEVNYANDEVSRSTRSSDDRCLILPHNASFYALMPLQAGSGAAQISAPWARADGPIPATSGDQGSFQCEALGLTVHRPVSGGRLADGQWRTTPGADCAGHGTRLHDSAVTRFATGGSAAADLSLVLAIGLRCQ